MEAPRINTKNKEQSNYFGDFFTSIQKKTNACIKTIKQNETVQKTTEAVAKYAPYVIGFVGSYFAPVAVTVGCLVTAFAISVIRPEYIPMQTFGKVVMGVSGSMFLTSVKAGVSLQSISLYFASTATYYIGAAIRDE